MTGRPSTGILLLAGSVALAVVYLLRTFRRCKAPSYILKNGSLEIHISAMGGIIQRLLVPDRKGKKADVVLGHDTLDEYLVRRRHAPGCMLTLSPLIYVDTRHRRVIRMCDAKD